MAAKILMPAMGMTMEEGTIVKWLKAEGERIEGGEPLLEILTDKVNMEIEAPSDGVLLKIVAQPNDVIPVMGLIGVIGKEGEDISAILAQGDSGAASEIQERAVVTQAEAKDTEIVAPRPKASPAARRASREQGVDLKTIRGSGPGGRIVEADILKQPKVTPVAQKLAQVRGVDLAGLEGSGLGGKIIREDIVQRAGQSETSSHNTIIPLGGIRKTVARRMKDSLSQAAHFTLHREVDVSGLVRLRETLAKRGLKLSYTDLLVLLVARVLREFPVVNSSWSEEGIIRKSQVNIGVAVALEEGLIVPVLKNADQLGLAQISTQVRALAERARTGGLTGEDLSGGSFTITNLGMLGIDGFTPIINQPESAILGVGRIVEKPVAEEGQIVIRPMLHFSLSIDHRVIDGAPGAMFLGRLAQLCSEPALVLV